MMTPGAPVCKVAEAVGVGAGWVTVNFADFRFIRREIKFVTIIVDRNLNLRSRVGLHRGLGHRLPSAQCASEKRALRDSEQDCPDQTPSVRNGHHFVRGSHGLDRRPDLLPTL
ncbi:hypothetical protein L596_004108 [Steinernema carpocapsae]|uniref:Uncharacterized protein n=1 Tax=Steinernema carpocapsae TaxID=34508 RepID=A0A4U8UUV0_STECR|nr:hypothetical protein L596_004108 [Steinernema carpocapsae]